LQPTEPLTVKEVSTLFRMSRQAMSKHISQLDKQYIAKNSSGYRVITVAGVLQLARKLGREELLVTDNITENTNKNNVFKVEGKLSEQLLIKDKQIEELHALLNRQTQLLDQQQQLTLQSNQRIEQLEKQLQIGLEKAEEETRESSVQETSVPRKKWWSFFQK
jgi:DNA-binding transcriptional regulator GbsR (MarR family)